MDIRYSTNPRDVKRYTTEELREEFHISGLYEADQVKAVYSHVDRMVTLGVMPVSETVLNVDEAVMELLPLLKKRKEEDKNHAI